MSLNDRLAAYLREREGLWIDGRVLSTVAGAYAWRSRLSDLRRAPYCLTIENRVLVVGDHSVSCLLHEDCRCGLPVRYKRSEYRLVPAQAQEHSA